MEVAELRTKPFIVVSFSPPNLEEFLRERCQSYTEKSTIIDDYHIRNHNWEKEKRISVRNLSEKVNIVALKNGHFISLQQNQTTFVCFLKVNNEVYRKVVVLPSYTTR